MTGHPVRAERQDGVRLDVAEQAQDRSHADLSGHGRAVAVVETQVVVLPDSDGGKAASQLA